MRSLVRPALIAAILAATSAPSAAQDSGAFSINMDRVRFGGPKKCAPTRTYVIPAVELLIEARNTMWAHNDTAAAKARVFVTGLSKRELQSLAGRVYDDLVVRLRVGGNTVITYDDIRAEAAGLDRRSVNPKYGMPTEGVRVRPGSDFLVATPSDEQAFAAPLGGGPGQKFNAIVKAHNATLVLPEIYLTLPQLGASKSSSMGMNEAIISSSPAMKLFAANIWRVPPNLGWCNILVAEHGVRLVSPEVGTFTQLGEDVADYGTWSRRAGDFAFAVDNAEFDAAVLRAGAAINALIAAN